LVRRFQPCQFGIGGSAVASQKSQRDEVSMEIDANPIKEVLDDLFSLLEALETQNIALLQFLKDQGIAPDDKLAPYLDRAGNASSVKWRAARARMNHLLAPAPKKASEPPAEKEPKEKEAEPKDATAKDVTAKDVTAKEGQSQDAEPKQPVAQKAEAADATPQGRKAKDAAAGEGETAPAVPERRGEKPKTEGQRAERGSAKD
jgi:hypothetical protein